MSHVVTIETEIRDPAAIRAACDRLHLPEPTFGEVKLFANRVTGWAISLPKWRYPAVADVSTGSVHYDTYEGRWGDQRHLDAFLQSYAVEKAKIESRRKGYTCTEQRLADGSIKLTVSVGGSA